MHMIEKKQLISGWRCWGATITSSAVCVICEAMAERLLIVWHFPSSTVSCDTLGNSIPEGMIGPGEKLPVSTSHL